MQLPCLQSEESLTSNDAAYILNLIADEMPGGFLSLRTLAEAGALAVGVGAGIYAKHAWNAAALKPLSSSVVAGEPSQETTTDAASSSSSSSATPDPINQATKSAPSRGSQLNYKAKGAAALCVVSAETTLYFTITQITKIYSLRSMAKYVLAYCEYDETQLSEKAKALLQKIRK